VQLCRGHGRKQRKYPLQEHHILVTYQAIYLNFLNEVLQSHETIRNIHAQVIDSCMAEIITRPVIRGNHMVHKTPLYFDEGTHSKPYQGQPVLPVTTLSTTRAKCRVTQSCGICAPFVEQGYDDTLYSLSVLRTDHPHVNAFADHPLTVGSHSFRRQLCWTCSRMMMTSSGHKTHSIVPIVRTPNRQMNHST